jgi:ankyrin repeat protein
LLNGSCSRFLSPVLQIDDIVSHAVTRKDIRDALTRLPLTLDAVLDNKIAEINLQDPRLRQIAADTLMWLSYAKRPLLIQELCEVLAMSSAAHLNQDDIPAPLFVKKGCMGLITIDPSSTVSLSHSSVVVYLRGEHNKLFSNGIVRACLNCLEYLDMKNFAESDLTPQQQTKALMQHPFLDYASSSWMYHVQDISHDEFALSQTLGDQLSRSQTTEPDPTLEDLKKLRSMLSRISALTQRLILRSSESSWPLLFHFSVAAMQAHRDGAHHEMTAPRRMTSGLSPLHICARFGFVTEARKFIQHTYSPPLPGTWTALHEAVRCNSLAIADMLIEKGHECDLKDEDDRTPLHYASYHGFKDMVLRLLTQDYSHLDIKEKTSKKTALHFAAKMGHEKVVTTLLEKGASIDIRDVHKRTALHYAAENGHTDVARVLMEKQADPTATDEKGQTALHCAVLGRSEDLVRLMLMQDQSSISLGDYFGRTPLHLAAERAFSLVVDMLLAEGANANAVDNNGKTPLIYAVQSGRSDVVEILLLRFADPNFDPGMPDSVTFAQSPNLSLHERPSLDIPQYETDSSGETALLLAVREGNKDMVKSLLAAGADLNWTNSRGEAALFIAISNDMTEIAKLLFHAGADPHAKTRSGSTPLEAAIARGNTELMTMFDWDFKTSSETNSKGSADSAMSNDMDRLFATWRKTSAGSILREALERSQSGPY